MKTFLRLLKFLLSSVLRLIPFVIFILNHLFWSIYTYTVNPLDLLNLSNVPKAIGEFKALYLALGVVIFIFMTLGLKFLGYSTFLGGFIGQVFYFLRIWENKIYNAGKPGYIYKWYIFILLGLTIGFVLQLLKTGGLKYYRQKKYEKIRNNEI